MFRTLALFLFAGFFFSASVSAQIIDEKEVASAVMDLFSRKFRKSTEPVWEMKKDGYGVNFLFKGKKVYAEFERGGRLVQQRTEMLLTELKPNIQQHLKRKYRSQVIRKAEYVQEFPTKKYYYIEVVPKKMAEDEDAPVTKLFYNSTGVFQSEGDPKKEGDEAEPAEELEIPDAVTKEFTKKVKKANEVTWSDVDTAFRADFKSGANEAYAIITPEGVWQYTSVKMKAKFKNLHPGIQKYFADNIEGYTFLYAEDVNATPNEKYFNVFILDKSDEPPLGEDIQPTKLQFTKSGKHIATFFPDYSVDELEVKEDKKWNKAANEAKVDQAGGNLSEKDIPRKELPTKAQEFLNKNYNNEWKTKVCKAIDDEEFGILYYVVMKKQGFDLSEEHYFDIHGNLVGETEE